MRHQSKFAYAEASLRSWIAANMTGGFLVCYLASMKSSTQKRLEEAQRQEAEKRKRMLQREQLDAKLERISSSTSGSSSSNAVTHQPHHKHSKQATTSRLCSPVTQPLRRSSGSFSRSSSK
jgi:hypothetical protein